MPPAERQQHNVGWNATIGATILTERSDAATRTALTNTRGIHEFKVKWHYSNCADFTNQDVRFHDPLKANGGLACGGHIHCCSRQRQLPTTLLTIGPNFEFSSSQHKCAQCVSYQTQFIQPMCRNNGRCPTCGDFYNNCAQENHTCQDCLAYKKFYTHLWTHKNNAVCTCDALINAGVAQGSVAYASDNGKNQKVGMCTKCKVDAIIEQHTEATEGGCGCDKMDCMWYPLLAMTRERRRMRGVDPRDQYGHPNLTQRYANFRLAQEQLAQMYYSRYQYDLLNNPHRCVYQTLEKTSPEYKLIESMMPPGSILYVKTVLNSRLFRRHHDFNKRLQEDASENVVPRALWHGASLDNCNNIAMKGWNRNHANACAFGKGCYFAHNSLYSMNDRYSPLDVNSMKYMILSLVTLGDIEKGTAHQESLSEKIIRTLVFNIKISENNLVVNFFMFRF